MIDPISAFAMATAAFNGIKRAVEIGKEAEEVFSQLSKWAGAVSDLQESINQMDNRKPGLFEKIGFNKSETAEAFDTFIAKQKIVEMEKEIYSMFLYGKLSHIGIDGYKEFLLTRRSIKEKREKMIYEQLRARAKFARKVINSVYIIVIIGLIGVMAFITINLVYFASNN